MEGFEKSKASKQANKQTKKRRKKNSKKVTTDKAYMRKLLLPLLCLFVLPCFAFPPLKVSHFNRAVETSRVCEHTSESFFLLMHNILFHMKISTVNTHSLATL